MECSEALTEAVIKALASAKATSSTTTTLRTLLHPAHPAENNAEAKKIKPVSRKTSVAKLAKPAIAARGSSKNAGKQQPFRVHEDESKELSTKEKQVLATNVINTALKTITQAAKSKTKQEQRIQTARPNATPTKSSRQPSRAPQVSQRALKARSGNSTPVLPSPQKNSSPRRTTPTSPRSASVSGESCSQILAVAECAVDAFHYLLSTSKPSSDASHALQLDKGLNILCGKLIDLNLDNLARKELRTIKRRLETRAQDFEDLETSRDSKAVTSGSTTDKSTLESLLKLDVDGSSSLETLTIAATYQLNVLRCLVNESNPTTLTSALNTLKVACPGGPVDIIQRCMKLSGDAAKTGQRLEVLSHLIMSLCPSASPSQDEIIKDSAIYPSPHIVFGLQSVALEIQKLSERFLDKKEKPARSMAEIFSKYLGAYLRRISTSCSGEETFKTAIDAYKAIEVVEPRSATSVDNNVVLFKIHRNLSILAERAGSPNDAMSWAEKAIVDAASLDGDHALRLTGQARRMTVRLRKHSSDGITDDIETEFENIDRSLLNAVTGSSSDLEILLAELSYLMDQLSNVDQSQDLLSSKRKTSLAIGRFTARYGRIGRQASSKTAMHIIDSTVTACKTTEELASWVTLEVVQTMSRAGVLEEISELASSNTLSHSWSSSRSGRVLGRILKGLVYKAIRSPHDICVKFIFDDDTLKHNERGILLEWQLVQALGNFRKKQNNFTGESVISALLERLDECYTTKEHPLRRTRVAIIVLRKAQENPDLIPPSILELWRHGDLVSAHALGEDHSLLQYLTDTNASMQVARAFLDSHPHPTTLLSALSLWENLLNDEHVSGCKQTVADPNDVSAQLKGLDDYFAMFGYQQERLGVGNILLRLCDVAERGALERAGILLTLVGVHLSMGCTQRAGLTLAQADLCIQSASAPKIKILQYQVCQCEYLLVIDEIADCRRILKTANDIRLEIEAKDQSAVHSRSFQLLASRVRLVQSKLELSAGSSSDSLRIAKQVSRYLNAVWSSSERSRKPSQVEASSSDLADEDADVHSIAKGISKLNLKPNTTGEKDSKSKAEIRGVAFWPLVPVLCDSLSHLSIALTHHGMYRDALYCLNQAMKVVDTCQFSELLPGYLTQRGALYTAAGQLEAAELDFTSAAEKLTTDPSLAKVDLLRAEAGLRLKEGLLDQASSLYEKAENTLQSVRSQYEPEPPISSGQGDGERLNVPAKKSLSNSRTPRETTTRSKATASTRSRHARNTSKHDTASDFPDKLHADSDQAWYPLHKLEAHIVLERTLTAFKLRGLVADHFVRLQKLFSSLPGTSQQRQVEFQGMMRKVATALHQDVSFNVLPESTLALPALMKPTSQTSSKGIVTSSRTQKANAKKTNAVVSKKIANSPAESLRSLLSTAADCLKVEGMSVRTTAETHLELALVSSVNMLLSATCLPTVEDAERPIAGALSIELPRMNATLCRAASAQIEKELHASKAVLFQSPGLTNMPTLALSTSDFQKDYIDILPLPWTVVSLSLSDEMDELYISRYRQGSSPLILRLPFARHKPDLEDEEPFDFETGKAELQDIIQLSNYTCHQPVDVRNKSARDKWWSEREALDRRLEELLINMENIWLGGFKGIFSQQRSDETALTQFRHVFEAALDRHLPSRNGPKRNNERLALDDAVLELFVDLKVNDDGEMELDEALTDLLYFVVDMLQFNGERNAYDEVDFDAMGVEVFDAIRAYHRSIENEKDAGKHTILVLDRRLQLFPWESLPCLNGVSVSRVDSMLTLRERILVMRNHAEQQERQGTGNGIYSVPRHSGSYILNPSGDLKHTAETLGPMLSTMGKVEGGAWSAIVKRDPSEEEFKVALSCSSTLLYFGHGAATQYIRPRTIRQLDSCSEVVWLIGCSSGSVTEYDELEPSSVPFEYLVAGHDSHDEGKPSRKCMAVLAMLWDVTDKDIDRFSLAVGDEWNLWSSAPSQTELPVKTPRKRDMVHAPSTPRQGFKTPKTPRVMNTPAPSRAARRSRSRPSRDRNQKASLVDAVARSRDVCYLRYLNGAAPVVYGVPVYLED